MPRNAVAQFFSSDFRQNPFEGVAAFPVLREFLSPCACGTTTQDTNKVRPMTREAHAHSLRPIRALQVVQCPSCGVCYKVTQKRQLLSLEKSKSSAVSVSPTTKFWFVLWAVVGVVLLFGESLFPPNSNSTPTVSAIKSAIQSLILQQVA